MARYLGKAFTLVELVVVLALVGLFAALLAPSAWELRGRNAQAVCLANLKQIAAASQWYATEDPREQLVPMMWMKVRKEHAYGFGGTIWSWRTALPIAFGGRTPVEPFPGIPDPEIMMDDWTWGVRRRPLNRYILRPTSTQLETFHCPADSGYPVLDAGQWGSLDAPAEAAGVACYDLLGSSYREAALGVTWVVGSAYSIARFTSGVPGQAGSAIASLPSKSVCEKRLFAV